MADKSGSMRGRDARAPEADRPDNVRNVVLVGHTGAGKTTLVEALLTATGTIARPGRVEDGSTVTDSDEIEHRLGRSVSLGLAPLEFGGIKVNLLDAPGYADFVGDLRAGLRAADAALFVVSAADGVDGATQLLWEECAAVEMPRAVVVTKLDSPRADFDEMVAICQRVFGDGVQPLYLPLLDDAEQVGGLIGLLSQRIYDYSEGGRAENDADPEHLELIEGPRNALIEGIIAESEDESLMDRYLGGEQIDVKVLIDDLETAVARGHFYPVLPVSPTGHDASAQADGTARVGTIELLELITKGFPAPGEHSIPAVTTPNGAPKEPLACDPAGPLVAEVVKTTSDPYVGRISLVRVFSGTLRPEQPVHVSGHGRAERGHPDHDVDEKVGALSCPLGKTQRPVQQAVAGDIVAVAKLSHAETGDTLSAKDDPALMEPWVMPDPLLPIAVLAKAKSDEDKLSQALGRLVAEDPTLRLEINPETHQLVLWCMGEAHRDVVLDRLSTRYGVAVETVPHRVSLRETFTAPAGGHGRHVKQSGGHGQYAICDIQVEPLPNGSGFEFVDKVVGGAVPRQFIPSVEKGVRTQLERGVFAGYPIVDLRVTLFDGKAHSVDSSDMAFQTAGALALKDAAGKVQGALLEPVDAVEIRVADEFLGAVMGDLSGRRGRVLGTEPDAAGRTLVRAEVPETELARYPVELRSLSHGTGVFTREYLRHEPMPAQLAAKIVAEAAES
ncbi:MAG TPA: elongation factor G-like protein EF-G2 [Actinocrinis sp.]|jgi:elongation factor G|uniref:elongation factor G-like protein EF-G2 n=1 Tax=Actinocrinis sp. TaxID=1920516 RepID=UPI002DDDA897|nr:elongation factor G-like protein EF-G2 [Actinocrinis sp.]HEV3173587.1 elongation factor G-like protein EF-G2 [Actinocrinis sp.]